MSNKLVLEKYCPAPESQIDIDPQGNIKVCCATNTKLCHLDDDLDWANFFNSKLWLDSKEEIQSGECDSNKICKNCISKEKNKLISQRNAMRHTAVLHEGLWDYSRLINMDIDLGNVCNLWCIMCSSRNSTKWTKIDPDGIMHRMGNQEMYEPFRFKRRYIDNVLDKMFTEVQRCNFKGGEPFAFKDFEYMLEWLLSKGCKSVEIITNGTLWTKKYNEIFSRFPSVFFSVSIDGSDDVSNWVRYDGISSYEVVKKNIRQMTSIKNARGSVIHVTMPYNIYTLPEYIMDMNELLNDAKWWLNFKQICINPKHLNVNNIVPLESRLEVARRLEALDIQIKYRFLDELINFIKTPCEPNVELQKTFIEFTNLANDKKSFSIWDEVPQLKKDLEHLF
jgi:MoaA/NifB/PqqE/SkfB family radical SAM enzyme